MLHPMRLLRIQQPFDHPDFIYELKLDGFRALAVIDGTSSGSGGSLNTQITRSIGCRSATLDGEIVCLDAGGRSNFYRLLFRRKAPFFCVFDAIETNGQDLRGLPLLEHKRRLFDVMPRVESRVRYVNYIHEPRH